jgi:hypothetical protein
MIIDVIRTVSEMSQDIKSYRCPGFAVDWLRGPFQPLRAFQK